MAKVTRYGYSNRESDEERRPARAAKKTSSPLVPLAVLFGIILGAVILARSFAGKKDATPVEAAPAATGPKPFEKYVEAPPTPREPSSRDGRAYPPAPEGLAESNPDWARALEIGDEADVLFDAAQAAKRADQTTLFLEKGNAAKAKYDEAFTLTAVWEEELLEKYGDRDRQVKAIMNKRTAWSDRLRVLHKSTGR